MKSSLTFGLDPLRLDTKAGDIAFFHVRLAHRASPIKVPAKNNSERKLGYFALAGANNKLSRRYKSWLDEYDIMNGDFERKYPKLSTASLFNWLILYRNGFGMTQK